MSDWIIDTLQYDEEEERTTLFGLYVGVCVFWLFKFCCLPCFYRAIFFVMRLSLVFVRILASKQVIQKPHLHFNGFAVKSGFSVLQEFGFLFFLTKHI